jgi:hypothetical protein
MNDTMGQLGNDSCHVDIGFAGAHRVDTEGWR